MCFRNSVGWKDTLPVLQILDEICQEWGEKDDDSSRSESFMTEVVRSKSTLPQRQEEFKNHWSNKV